MGNHYYFLKVIEKEKSDYDGALGYKIAEPILEWNQVVRWNSYKVPIVSSILTIPMRERLLVRFQFTVPIRTP